MAKRYFWDATRRLYVDESGNVVSQTRLRKALERSIKKSTDKSANLARMIREGEIAPGDARNIMRREIKRLHTRQFLLGRGGRNAMNSGDWGTLGNALKKQYRYLEGFINQAYDENSGFSLGRIRSRINLYFNSSRESHSRGVMRAYGKLQLPAHPGDGTTDCLTNCRCSPWRIEEVFDDSSGFRELLGWNCYWVINPAAESCATCLNRADKWNPLFVRAEQSNFASPDDGELYKQ